LSTSERSNGVLVEGADVIVEHDLLGLPQLGTVLDVDYMEGVLGAAGIAEAVGVPGSRVERTSLVSLQSGSRALVAIELTGSREAATVVLAKHFARPAHARRVYRTMRALFDGDFRHDSGLGVPRPLGLVSELGLVLYAPAPGRHLNEVLFDGDADAAVLGPAQWLARLHRSELRLARCFDLDNEVANVRTWAELVERACPAAADRAVGLARDLRRAATWLQLDDDTPIHKDLHYRHVLVGDRVCVIDFDEMRMGDPSFDVAHFCTYLRLLAIRHDRSVEHLERAFVDEYTRLTGWTKDERFDFFVVYTCIKIARQLCLMRGVLPIASGAERERQLAAVVNLAGDAWS
jgi:streptomycin 6-kinase